MSASIYPLSGLVILDNNGGVAPGAKFYFYDAETTTPRDTYSDSDLTSERTHPVVADGNGRVPIIYLQYGAYDVKCTTSGGTQLFYHQNIANPEPFDDTTSFDTTTVLATGDIFSSLVNGTRTGAVRLNGRTIGNASSSATERANADTSNLFAFLWNNLADSQAAVSGGRGASAAQDFAANKRLTLPDFRGATLSGFDDMGNSAVGHYVIAPIISGDGTTSGSLVGGNSTTLTEAQLPGHTHGAGSFSATSNGAHTHALTGASAVSNGAHTHGLTAASAASSGAHTHTVSGGTIGGTGFTPTGAGGGALDYVGNHANIVIDSGGAHTHTLSGNTDSNGAHTHTLSGTTDSDGAHTHTVSGASGSTGSGSAHNTVQRSGLVTWFIKL